MYLFETVDALGHEKKLNFLVVQWLLMPLARLTGYEWKIIETAVHI